VIREVDALRGLVSLQGLVGRQQRENAAARDGDAVIVQDRAGGLDRDDAARADE
jgi:hypothetical protein